MSYQVKTRFTTCRSVREFDYYGYLNPFNAETTFFQSTRIQRLLKTI